MAPRLMSMLKFLQFLFVVSFALFANQSFSDRAETQDGSIFYGKIIEAKDGNLTFETTYSGLIQIPLKYLKTLSSSENVSVRDESNQTFIGQSVPVPVGQLNLVNQQKDPSPSIAFAKVQHLWVDGSKDPIVLQKEMNELEKRMKWQNSIGFDWVGSAGNTDSSGLGLRLDSVYSNNLHELDLFLSYNTQTTNGKTDTDETKGGAEFDSLFSDRFAWYLRSDFEHDPIEKINLRNTSAIGIKYDLIEEENYQLSSRLGTAFRYVESTEKSIVDQSDPAFDLGLEYSHLLYQSMAVESEVSLIPKANDLSDYLFNHDTALSFPILGENKWKLRSGLSGTYNSTPQDNSEKMDMKYYLRVIYEFQ
jgi:putative salt-induced outer membrane protein YdiY